MIKTVCVNMLIKQVQSWSTVICVMYNFQRWGEDEIRYCLWILETTNIELLLYVACSSLISHHFILYIVVSRFGDCQFVSWKKEEEELWYCYTVTYLYPVSFSKLNWSGLNVIFRKTWSLHEVHQADNSAMKLCLCCGLLS